MVVDDEPYARDHLCGLLRGHGYAVTAAADATSCLHLVAAGGVDLVLTELVAGAVTGLDLCEQLREVPGLSVIVVSRATADVDKVLALEIGADDYVTKPYGDRELLSRIAAVLRRQHLPPPTSVVTRSALGRVALDGAGLLADVADRRVQLSLQEFRLLAALVAAEGRVLSRVQLAAAVWDQQPAAGGPHDVEVCVRRLRRKVEPDPRTPALVLTVRGLGYRFGTHTA